MRAIPPGLRDTEPVLDPDGRNLPVALFRNDTDDSLVIVTRWTLTDDERAALVRGDDLYVLSFTDRNELQVFQPTVEPPRPEGVPKRTTDALCPRCQQRERAVIVWEDATGEQLERYAAWCHDCLAAPDDSSRNTVPTDSEGAE